MTELPEPAEPTPRTAARMFLIDPDDRVLLLHDRRELNSTESHWITPGGGVEDGESLTDAACREVLEETGLVIALPAEQQPMYVERVAYRFAGSYFDQTNHYFLARVPAAFEIEPTANTDNEKLAALGYRWWTLLDLDACDEVIEPVTMVELIRQALVVE